MTLVSRAIRYKLHHSTKRHLASSAGLSSDFLEFRTLHELNRNAVAAYHDSHLFGTFTNGSFRWMTYGEFGKRVDLCRALLKDVGVTPYCKVGIISNNRHEWATVAAATYSLNATLVPMYEAQLPKDWAHILNDSQCHTLITSSETIYSQVKNVVMPSTPLLKDVICLDCPVDEPNSFERMMTNMMENEYPCEAVEPKDEDLANLIYTSGTTGRPKGVELMHSNQVSNIKAGRDMVVDPSDFVHSLDRSLAFLPWAHSYGQTCELWCLLSQGASMGISRGIPHIIEDLQHVQPTLLFAVPTLYKRVHDGVINTMNQASPIQRTLMRAALRLGRANAAHLSDKASPLGFLDGWKYSLLDEIVLSKIRGRFGGKLRAGFVAGAACPKEIIEFMDAVGIPICEGYGLTETSPVISMNVLGRRKAGAVGQVLKGVTVHILDPEGNPVPAGTEGEICCSGPNVMKGYHNNPAATNEVISLAADGETRIFHTGDLGTLDSDGFLAVTGRIKEQYKLENGKYVCPAPIEQAVGMSRFISQVVICGANRPYNVALVVPDWLAVRSELSIPHNVSEEVLVNDSRVKGLMSAEIKLNCYNIKKFEIPMAWAFVAPFTAANNMITPKMSIRRHVVIKTYEDLIDGMYGGKDISGAYLGETNESKVA